MRQPDKHKKMKAEDASSEKLNKSASSEKKEQYGRKAIPDEETSREISVETVPTLPEDGDFEDGPDGTFAESVGITRDPIPEASSEAETSSDKGDAEDYLSDKNKAESREAEQSASENISDDESGRYGYNDSDYKLDDAAFAGDTSELNASSRAKGEAAQPQTQSGEENSDDTGDSGKETKPEEENLGGTEASAAEKAVDVQPLRVKKKKKSDEKPLWMKNPEKYRKKRPFFVRLLGGIWSFIFFWCLTFGVIGVITVGAAFTIIYSFTDSELDDKLANLELDYTSIIYTNSIETGNYVAYEELYNNQNRVWVSIDEMPDYLLDAVVAIEDKRFYMHKGVDIIPTFKATFNYVIAKLTGKNTSGLAGGSTLTQQLVKNITGDNQSSPIRKIKEMLRSLYVERKYNKDQILEYYLNAVNFGNNQDGIYAAAKYYFNKEVKDLTLTECAAIVSITKSPSYLEPYNNPDENRERRITVLYYMLDQGKLSSEEYNEAKNTELSLRDRSVSSSSTSTVMSWFSDMVFEDVKSSLMEKFGYTSSQAVSLIYTGGLRIYTTMVKEYQKICEDYFYNEDNYLPTEEDEEKPEVAFELFDPDNGNILAVIGGRGEKDQDRLLNRATQTVRQPGSAIKPVTVYGYAIENNIVTAASAIDDSPLMITSTAINLLQGQSYLINPVTGTEIRSTYAPWPTNYDNTYNGYIDVKNALSNSYNTPAAKVLSMIGVETSFNFAKTMLGLKSLVASDMNLAPLSVGALTYGLTLQELTAAYTTFANEGIYSTPRCVTRVESYDGKILYENEIDRQIVFTPQTAYIMTSILDDLKGSAADAELTDVPTAGKSGTTTSYKDRWFIGYTPDLLAGIWWGYDKPNTNENTHHINMWHDVMTLLSEASGTAASEFTEPDGIVEASYCTVSGLKPTKACAADPRSSSRIKTGIYKAGTEPTEYCNMHHYVYVCKETGQIACENCTDVELAVFIDSDRSFPYMYIHTKDAEFICPPLSADTVLYNSQKLPAYTYMVPEGQYPTLPVTSKKYYANCICHVHATSGINHYYTYRLLSASEKSTIAKAEANMSLPDALIDPDTLYAFYSDTDRYKPTDVPEVSG